MAIVIPTLTELFDEMRAFLTARTSDILTGPDTDIGARILMLRDAIYGIYHETKLAEQNIFIQTCDTDSLLRHAEALGLSRKPAVGSSGIANIEVEGESLAVVSAGDVLVDSDGLRFEIIDGAVLSGSGPATLSCRAISTGSATNKDAGQTLTFEAPGAGVVPTATIVDDGLTGGADEETDGELRARTLYARQNPPAGGRASDYYLWTMSVPGVKSAYIYVPSSYYPSGRRGVGTVDIAILQAGSGADRIPTRSSPSILSELEQSVADYLETVRPACVKDINIEQVEAVETNIAINVTAWPGYEDDWTGGITPALVDTYTPGATSFVLQDLPDDDAMIKGHRIQVVPGNFGSGNATELKTIVSRVGKTVTIDSAFEESPVHDDIVYPAGPLNEPVISALVEYIDSLGPARGNAADPNQQWEDTSRLAKIFDIVMGIEGVKDCIINYPASNVSPADNIGGTGTLELLVVGSILIGTP